MADVLANMISGTRAQFAHQAHRTLSNAHGHHFAARAQRAPPQLAPQRRPPPKRPLPAMMDPPTPVDPEKLVEQKQKKIAAHNARITALNNSKAKEPTDAAEAEPK